MIKGLRGLKGEYLGEKEIAKGAPRLPSVFTTERLLTNSRSDFPFGGHRLSSLYRKTKLGGLTLTFRYLAASFSLKYSNSTYQRALTPGNAT